MMIKSTNFFQPNERRSEKKAVWEDRHGYQNKMAEDEWTNGSSWNGGYGWNEQNPSINYNTQPTYITQTTRQQPNQRPNHRSSPKKDGFSSLFVAETSFPSWED
jgi:hypothetical protein